MRRLPLPRSLKAQLLGTYLGLVLLGLGALIGWTGYRLQADAHGRAERDLALQAHLIADALGDPLESARERGGRVAALQNLVDGFARSTGNRVTVFDGRFQVVASSDERVPARATEQGRELLAGRDNRPESEARRDPWSGEERLFVAAPISEEHGQAIGYLQLSQPTAPLYAAIAATWLSLLGAGCVVLLLIALASLALARQIADPIRGLTLASEKLAAGDLDRRVEPSGPDETRRLGAAFNAMAERLQDQLARQRAFVAHAAHEFRSPLTRLRLRLELLQGPARDDPALQQHYLAEMEQEVESVRAMLDYLLTLAALDEAEQRPRAPLDLAPLLYEVADAASPLARQVGLALSLDVPSHLPAIEGSPEQLRMLVRNLLDNAIKYTPAGGSVRLAAQAESGEVQIQVADTGLGIPPEALPHVFERFYRVDSARSRQQGGVGLGLALVRSIAEAHGGRVEAASRPAAGSTFTVHLPTAARDAAPARTRVAPTG